MFSVNNIFDFKAPTFDSIIPPNIEESIKESLKETKTEVKEVKEIKQKKKFKPNLKIEVPVEKIETLKEKHDKFITSQANLSTAKLNPVPAALYRKACLLAKFSIPTKEVIAELKKVQILSEVLALSDDPYANDVCKFILHSLHRLDKTFTTPPNLNFATYEMFIENELFCNVFSTQLKTSSQKLAGRLVGKVFMCEATVMTSNISSTEHKYCEMLMACEKLDLTNYGNLVLFVYLNYSAKKNMTQFKF